MRAYWLLLPLGFGVLALAAFRGEPDPAADALAASPLQPSDSQISESAAREKCEAATVRAPPSGVSLQFSTSVTGSRPLDGGRSVKVKFSAKNFHNVDLDFRGWCVVWNDGRTEITSIIETTGRDFLASSHPPSVRNAYLHRLRSRKIAKTVSLDELNEPIDRWDAEPLVIESEKLQEVLNELPEAFRTPLVLYFFEEFSYRQIADQLGVPVGTVMSRLARAKAFLRDRLLRVEPALAGGRKEKA